MSSSSNVYQVTSLEDSNAKGTFRNALSESRKNIYSVISFAVSGVIKLNSSLPTIISTVIIDATSAPGYNGTPVVEVDCNGYNSFIFELTSNSSVLQGISITNSGNSGITLKSGNNTIIKNYIGVDIYGKVKGNKKNGICLFKSTGNIIGNNTGNVSGYVSNVISGNGENGIQLNFSSANKIQSNFIGTDATGKIAIPNKLNGIIVKCKSSGNQIGGTDYTNSEGITNNPTGNKGTVPIVFIFPPLGNLISGNGKNGVIIVDKAPDNVLNGNFIGVDVTGINVLGNNENGVHIQDSDNNVLRGCLFDENPFVYYNVCSGNGENGLFVKDSNGIVIQGNFFGIGANNQTVAPNKLNGFHIAGNSKKVIGGGPIPLGNVCSGNKLSGVLISDNASEVISYNNFCGLLAFQGPAPNKNGIVINSSGIGNIITTCITSGNLENGIVLENNANYVSIDTVLSGLLSDGQNILPNGKNGLLIKDSANNNIIGKEVPSVITRGVFSANNENGICISGNANKNKINLTYIGLDIIGQNINIGNKLDGIRVEGNANNNFIGVKVASDEITNFSSANYGYGVNLTGNSYKNVVENNYIGLTSTKIKAPNKLGTINNDSTKANTNIIKNNITN